MAISLPTLDAHAHISAQRTPQELVASGAVLAMTLSLEEAEQVKGRCEPRIIWGVGCHPRKAEAQKCFDVQRFRQLAEQSAVVGEIGLDSGSSVPLEVQLRNFRQALDVLADLPRFVSIHSYRATDRVLEELRERPLAFPVLHWWTGSAAETQKAVEMGCYFSLHSAVARHSKFRLHVPPERVLLESDHGYNDPPEAIPCRVEWVEHLVGQQYIMSAHEVRRLAWKNLAEIMRKTGCMHLLPETFSTVLSNFSQIHY